MRRPITSLLIVALVVLLVFPSALNAAPPTQSGPWPAAKVASWAREHPWLVGCNFSPSTAINQLEMWQVDTFDLSTIDRELGWAESLGFNSIRVFLHHLPWERGPQAFLQRIEQFLATTDRHRIGVMFVLLDGVWDPFPHSGKQHPPRSGLHNSGWVQSPGLVILKNPDRHDELVADKTQTIYPWDSWQKPYTDEPPVWFHDIFHPDGSPYNPTEVEYIPSVTGARM
jgi:hypothetical protein